MIHQCATHEFSPGPISQVLRKFGEMDEEGNLRTREHAPKTMGFRGIGGFDIFLMIRSQ